MIRPHPALQDTYPEAIIVPDFGFQVYDNGILFFYQVFSKKHGSLGGETGGIATALNQLDLMGIFDQVSGILLGTFSKYEKAGLSLSVYDLLKKHIPDSLPVARTAEIGHGAD